MFNPFNSVPYIESADGLFERSDQLVTLRNHFRNRVDTVLFGPEGSGKTVLLRCFFNREFRRKMAQQHTLIYLGEFKTTLDSEGTYGFFADAIRSAVEDLEFYGLSDQMEPMLRSLDNIRYDSKSSRFAQCLNKIQGFGFRMVFVLDNFENFTSSPNVKPEHHDLLCGMLNDSKLQLIVASNYDFNETSLPEGIRNSKLLTRLSPHTVHMTPLSAAACQLLLDRIADDAKESEDMDEAFRFTPEQMQLLHSLSGGIPHLLHKAAKHAFDVFQENGEFEETEIRSRTLRDVMEFLKHWCTVTPKVQLDLLADLKENTNLSETDETTAGALENRGLLCKAYVTGRDGRRIAAEGYTYNSGLFRAFCSHREWLEEVLEKNPLRKEAAPTGVFDPMALLSGNPGAPIIIQEMTVHHGDTYDNSVQNSVTYQPTVIADKGFARLFGLLDLEGEELGSQLLDIFKKTTATPSGIIDADALAEETAERITSMFIPEEIEQEALEECQEEQQTLESRFNAIRSQIDPDGLLDDALLDSLSIKCRLYLQIAFVVDEALSALSDFHLGDLSAQMVMYGKVLEQQLKDNLYKLFHRDDVLKNIDTYTNNTAPGSTNNFGYMELHKTSIGNYMRILQRQSSRLEALCSAKGISFAGQSPDALWWEALGNDVNIARDLRNAGDHAGRETSQTDLERMRHLLFGHGNILRRCGAGMMLTHAIWPAPVHTASSISTGDDKAAFKGQIVQMTNIQVTPRSSIRGIIAGTAYGVSISKRHLDAMGCRPQDLLGKTIQVRITQWDNNPSAQKFNAELL